MVYSLFVVGLSLVSSKSIGQALTGKELLQKSIAYHDPNGVWPNFQGKLAITMTTPDGKKRNTQVFMDFTKAYYKRIVKQDVHTITDEFTAGECILKLNNSTVISDAFRESLNINCEQAKKMKDYYTYLYGLPMKLNDDGTIVDDTVETVNFNDKTYLRLKVTYEEAVGGDTWYFYFDPATYAWRSISSSMKRIKMMANISCSQSCRKWTVSKCQKSGLGITIGMMGIWVRMT